MTLTVEFNFTPADNDDPMSLSDCEIVEMWLCGPTEDNKLPDRIQNDIKLNHHLLAALYRLHQVMPK